MKLRKMTVFIMKRAPPVVAYFTDPKAKTLQALIWVVNKRNQRYIVGVANQIYVIDRVKIAVKFNRFMNSFIVQHLTKLQSEQRFVDMNRNFDRLSKKSLTTALIFCWHDVN